MSNSPKNIINLQLGDIIEIIAPTDDDINNNTYYISYIDLNEINIINKQGEETILHIDDGKFRNESIESVIILSRDLNSGYSLQNNLFPDKWVDIYFSGDVPAVITGKITNLEEDQIEITMYENGEDKIYIDFAYKGIPKDIPIDKIIIRESSPQASVRLTEVESQNVESQNVEAFEEQTNEEIQAQIRSLLLDADQIIMGEDLEEITQFVNVSESEQRYGIDKQMNDLLDELLSTIPNVKRTESVLNNVHKLIERFKQLRQEFSTFDDSNHAVMPKIQGADYKPLVNALENLNKKLYWIIPVVKNRKKLYDLDSEVQFEYPDIVPLTGAEIRIGESNVVNIYSENQIPNGDNKYAYLIKETNKYLTPFTSAENVDDVIITKRINENLLAIVDNMGEFYSSIAENDNVKRKRFLIQEYNLGENMMDVSKIRGGSDIVKSINITLNDTMHIKSFLTLPEPVVKFSHINLPATNLLNKTNLNMNFIHYWKLLNKRTKTSTIIVDNLDKPLEHDPKIFLNDINEYSMDVSIVGNTNISDADRFNKYLNTILPKTRILFDLVKSNIKEKLSIHDILKYLEPFMIYQKDISFKQYQEFNIFIYDKIREYKRNYIQKSKEYNFLRNNKTVIGEPSILKLINSKDILDTIKEFYYFDSISLKSMTNSEILYYMNSIDNCYFFNSVLSSLSVNLMISDGKEKIEDLEKWMRLSTESINKNVNTCNTREIAKSYMEMDELEDDNEKDIFFDKKYDKTYYDLINEYENLIDRKTMSIEHMVDVISKKLQEINGLNVKESVRTATSLLNGKKTVENGDYAMLFQEINDDVKPFYYVRNNNIWEKDSSVSKDIFANTNKLFCNLSMNCFEINNKCEDIKDSAILIQNDNVKQIIDEFDATLSIGKNEIVSRINKELKQNMMRAKSLSDIHKFKLFKNNNINYNYGLKFEDNDITLSPYLSIRDVILGQGDFIKRQHDIVKFVALYTRPASPTEELYWLYCIKTNTKLLPSFIAKLAIVFNENLDYLLAIRKICAEQGTISDEGDAWVDKYSGYTITQIDFDSEEGFTDEGFKLVSRSIMEADIGQSIMTLSDKKNKYENPEAEKIFNVANAIGNYSGVDLTQHVDFIIRNAMQLQSKTVPNKESYQRAIARAAEKSGKNKRDTYEIFSDQSLIIITLSYYLISVVTSIPSIKTRKRHPGCVRSFTGFPLNGVEDKSAMNYIACIANKIKSSLTPWNSIQKLNQQKLADRIEATIDKLILSQNEIQVKLSEKLTYNNLNVEEQIPFALDIKGWMHFMPPLFSINLGTIQNITNQFATELESNLKKGSKKQFDNINVIRSKIIFFSIKIIESIQHVVNKKMAILTNNNKEPFLENSCCDDGSTNTMNYFINIDPTIVSNNNVVLSLTNLLTDVERMSKASILFDPSNTKRTYPEISSQFSEETIIQAFIMYCKYNSNLPINNHLKEICENKPDNVRDSDSMAEKIKKLKGSGKNYNIEAFEKLMAVVNKNNIVNINLHHVIISNVQLLKNILHELQEQGSNIISPIFIDNFNQILDTFTVGALIEDTPAMRKMKNYLERANTENEIDIMNFMKLNSSGKISKEFEECIRNITNFKQIGDNVLIEKEDETIYKMIAFIKNSIRNLIHIFPNMIKNKIDYNTVSIPQYWKLSERHNKDLKEIMNKHYSLLYKFYDNNNEFKKILDRIQQITINLELLVNNSEFYAPLKTQNGYIYSAFDRRMTVMLFKFYFLSIFKYYISIISDDDILTQSLTIDAIELSPSVDLIVEQEQGYIPDNEIITGEKKIISQNLASLFDVYSIIIHKEKLNIDYNYESLMERVTRSKEKEKDIITNYLKEMTDEEREIENIFKNNKLENWSKGLQKGVRIYQADTYDDEREAMEKQAIIEMKLGKTDLVTDMNKNIYAMEELEEQDTDDRIDTEENDLTNFYGNDGEEMDDDMDGDEYY